MKKSKPVIVKEQTMLRVPKAKAAEKINKQLQDGEGMQNNLPINKAALEAFEENHKIWSEYTVQLLLNLFTDSSISDEFNSASNIFMMDPHWDVSQIYRYYLDNQLKPELSTLRSIIKRLEIIDVKTASYPSASVSVSKSVFIVHGSDLATKDSVARFTEHADLDTIVLQEKPSQGMTIIQKFHAYSDVGFVIVLFTPDDIGGRDTNTLQNRARQNVIFELGYFVGKLGIGKTCILKKGELEIPSDLSGVIYINLDDAGAWQKELAKEIHASGMPFDFKKAFGG